MHVATNPEAVRARMLAKTNSRWKDNREGGVESLLTSLLTSLLNEKKKVLSFHTATFGQRPPLHSLYFFKSLPANFNYTAVLLCNWPIPEGNWPSLSRFTRVFFDFSPPFYCARCPRCYLNWNKNAARSKCFPALSTSAPCNVAQFIFHEDAQKSSRGVLPGVVRQGDALQEKR